jgi:hypothetical protein
MVALYLTDKFSTKKPNPNRIMSGDHTEVELLLERLQKQVEEIVGEVGRMVVRTLFPSPRAIPT